MELKFHGVLTIFTPTFQVSIIFQNSNLSVITHKDLKLTMTLQVKKDKRPFDHDIFPEQTHKHNHHNQMPPILLT